MRLHIVRPAEPGRFPGVLFFSEIFQVTAPIRRLAAVVAGHGYLVAMPEVYHEYEAPGTVLRYDQPGTDRGNALKTTKPIAAFDADAKLGLAALERNPPATGVWPRWGYAWAVIWRTAPRSTPPSRRRPVFTLPISIRGRSAPGRRTIALRA
jgi:hypothetical protein